MLLTRYTDLVKRLQTVTKKPYENEVILTGQNLPLKYYFSLELFTKLKRGLDL